MSKKISELTDALALDGSEQLEVVQSGNNKKITVNDLFPVQLQSDRLIGLNGHELRFEETSASYLQIQPEAEAEVIRLKSHSSETNTDTYLHLNSSTDAGWGFELEADKSGVVVSIEGSADENQLEYNASNHVYPGLAAKDFADDAAAAVGNVPVEGLYHTSGTLKIRLV